MFSNEFPATICNGELAIVVVVPSTTLFAILGGLLHVHCLAADDIPGLYVSVGAHGFVFLSLSHTVSGGTANTIQFPPRSLNGFGNALPTVYGPKHIAIPSPSVSVGAIYNLNCEGYVPPGVPKKKSSVAHLNGYQKNPGIGKYHTAVGHRLPGIFNSGIPLPSVVFKVLNNE